MLLKLPDFKIIERLLFIHFVDVNILSIVSVIRCGTIRDAVPRNMIVVNTQKDIGKYHLTVLSRYQLTYIAKTVCGIG